MTLSVFGKLPSQGDFFRAGPSSPVLHEAERWLTQSYEHLRGAGLEVPSGLFHFVLASPQWPEIVVATATGSGDSVGRRFPLVGFATIDAGAVSGRGWAIPVLCAQLFESFQSVLQRAAETGDAQTLVNELGRLPPVDPAHFAHADAILTNLANAQSARAFEDRVFQHIEQRYYAYRTLRMACEQVRGSVPDLAAIVLGTPVSVDVDVVAWSAMLSMILRWPVVLPMMWGRVPQPKMVISLGPLPPQSMRFLVDESADSMKYWPLLSVHQGALASAQQELEPKATWDQPGESLSGLFNRIATFG